MAAPILLVGDRGMLGRAFRELLTRPGPRLRRASTCPTSTPPSRRRSRRCSASRGARVINCAAYTNVDGAEEQRGGRPARQRDRAARAGRGLRGRRHPAGSLQHRLRLRRQGHARPIRRTRPCDPLGAYGRTKAAGEQAIRASGAPPSHRAHELALRPVGQQLRAHHGQADARQAGAEGGQRPARPAHQRRAPGGERAGAARPRRRRHLPRHRRRRVHLVRIHRGHRASARPHLHHLAVHHRRVSRGPRPGPPTACSTSARPKPCSARCPTGARTWPTCSRGWNRCRRGGHRGRGGPEETEGTEGCTITRRRVLRATGGPHEERFVTLTFGWALFVLRRGWRGCSSKSGGADPGPDIVFPDGCGGADAGLRVGGRQRARGGAGARAHPDRRQVVGRDRLVLVAGAGRTSTATARRRSSRPSTACSCSTARATLLATIKEGAYTKDRIYAPAVVADLEGDGVMDIVAAGNEGTVARLRVEERRA